MTHRCAGVRAQAQGGAQRALVRAGGHARAGAQREGGLRLSTSPSSAGVAGQSGYACMCCMAGLRLQAGAWPSWLALLRGPGVCHHPSDKCQGLAGLLEAAAEGLAGKPSRVLMGGQVGAEPTAYAKLEGLGKVPFSNIRRPRPLMDLEQPPGAGGREGREAEVPALPASLDCALMVL